MTTQFLVRVGALGSLHRFVASGTDEYARNMRVVCRTERGLEIGEILAGVEDSADQPAGTLVRTLTPDDDAHLARLRLRGEAAYRCCRQWMQQARVFAVLLDVEALFDGQSLHFYFADPLPPHTEPLRQQLARMYQAEVRFHAIVQQPAGGSCDGAGCNAGGCGDGGKTDSAAGKRAGSAGCSAGGCESCSVANICGKRQRLYGAVQAVG